MGAGLPHGAHGHVHLIGMYLMGRVSFAGRHLVGAYHIGMHLKRPPYLRTSQ
jgi:hypothetical protein